MAGHSALGARTCRPAVPGPLTRVRSLPTSSSGSRAGASCRKCLDPGRELCGLDTVTRSPASRAAPSPSAPTSGTGGCSPS
eukprot:14341272-Alexandrium_andersonii.AAC.1